MNISILPTRAILELETLYSTNVLLLLRSVKNELVEHFQRKHLKLQILPACLHREKNTLEPKAECCANDKVKSPPLQRFLVIFSTATFISFTKTRF